MAWPGHQPRKPICRRMSLTWRSASTTRTSPRSPARGPPARGLHHVMSGQVGVRVEPHVRQLLLPVRATAMAWGRHCPSCRTDPPRPSLNRCTQSLNVWRSFPAASATSARDAPSKTKRAQASAEKPPRHLYAAALRAEGLQYCSKSNPCDLDRRPHAKPPRIRVQQQRITCLTAPRESQRFLLRLRTVGAAARCWGRPHKSTESWRFRHRAYKTFLSA